jgi:hypothetical protein
VTKGDLQHAREWYAQGYTQAMKTPDDTLVFVDAGGREDHPQGPGRLHGLPVAMRFSSWADNEKNSTGRLADPRSFCIQKTLQDIAHGGPSTEPDVRRPLGVPLQDRPLLLERLRADGEAAGRPDPDGGVMRGGGDRGSALAAPAAAQDKTAALLGLDRRAARR